MTTSLNRQCFLMSEGFSSWFGFKTRVKCRETMQSPVEIKLTLDGWREAIPLHRSAGDGHQVVFGGTCAAGHHEAVLAVEHRVEWWRWWRGCRGLCLVQDADGPVFTDAIWHFIWVYPQSQLTGKQREQLPPAQPDPAARLAQERVHFVVDPDTAITRTFLWPVWEPVVLVVLCK